MRKGSAPEGAGGTAASLNPRRPTLSSTQGVVGLCWLIGFLCYFYSFDLPNNSSVSRLDLWWLLPENLLDVLIPPVSNESGPPFGWRYLPQRLPFLGIALFVFAAAAGWGLALLTLLNVSFSAKSWERLAIAIGLGLSWLSLCTLGLGWFGVLAQWNAILLLAGGCGLGLWSHDRQPFSVAKLRRWLNDQMANDHAVSRATLACHAVIIPFLMILLLGAMLPSIDFDVKEYHLQGPKEYYQNGGIGMLPHNVYTSFPFLTEMLTLLCMTLYGDWYWGAVAGKTVLAGFAPLTALGVYALARRYFGVTAGWSAMLIHLSTPWTYRISIIAYAEGGLTCYLLLSLLATAVTIELWREPGHAARLLVCGLLAGSAASCKYPGVLSVVIPLGFALVFTDWWKLGRSKPDIKHMLQAAVVFSLGVLIAFGPWLLKNLIETGNPVYPLLYSLFGGMDWSPELNARWKAAHGPDHHHLSDLFVKLIDVTAKSDWQSPLLFGLAPLTCILARKDRFVFRLWIFFGWLFLSWWVLTHRIDRFWIPLIPVIAVLAGIGFSLLPYRFRQIGGSILAIAMLFNFAFMTTGLCGYNAYRVELNAAREWTGELTAPEVMVMNELMSNRTGTVLCVGEAEMFDATFDPIYNTVFDVSIFERWCGVDEEGVSAEAKRLRPASEIQTEFRSNEVRYVLVNWSEILRYQLTYGYTRFVTPRRFTELIRMRILDQPINFDTRQPPPFLRPWESLSKQEQDEIKAWAPELIREYVFLENGVPRSMTVFVTAQVYAVVEK